MAVITAFLVPALQSLDDPADQTNDLLHNLTAVILQLAELNGMQVAQTASVREETQNTSNEILSFLWTMSLVLAVGSLRFR